MGWLQRLDKMRAKPLIGLGQGLRKDTGFSHYGNKTGIAAPAGKNMHVEMVGNSCAGRAPQVETKIEALRLIFDSEGALALLPQFEKFMQFL